MFSIGRVVSTICRRAATPSSSSSILAQSVVSTPSVVAVRGMGGGGQSRFLIRLTRHQRTKFMRSAFFYISLPGLPILYAVYYGVTRPGYAVLRDIPEGYEPEYHEYFHHPVTRFLAKTFSSHPQRYYEKELGKIEKTRQTVLQRMCQERAKLINRRTGESMDINDHLMVDKYKQGRTQNQKTQLIQSPNSIYNAKDTMKFAYDKHGQ